MLTERQAKFIEAEARDQQVWEVVAAVGPMMSCECKHQQRNPERQDDGTCARCGAVVKTDLWGVELRLHYSAQYWVTSLHQWLKLHDKVDELREIVAEAQALGCRIGSSFPTRVGKDSLYVELGPPPGHASRDFLVRIGAQRTWEQYKAKWFDFIEGTTVEEHQRALPSATSAST